MEKLNAQATVHNSEFRYLIGTKEVKELETNLLRSLSGLKEPFATVINKNLFVHSSIPWDLLEQSKKMLHSGKSLPGDDHLGSMNSHAKVQLGLELFSKEHTTYYYSDNSSTKCKELDKVLVHMGVSELKSIYLFINPINFRPKE
jgi:hypothetical protein